MSSDNGFSKAAEIIQANQIPGRVKQHRYEFKIPVGTTIHIGGIPYTYMGEDWVGGGTNPDLAFDGMDVKPDFQATENPQGKEPGHGH